MSVVLVAENPFSDPSTGSATLDRVKVIVDRDYLALVDKLSSQTISRPNKIEVPILQALSSASPWSPLSSSSEASNTSTARTSPSSDTFLAPIQWSNADLMYLLSCILPSELLTNRLVFSPALEDLPHVPSPVHLQLFILLPIDPPPSEAYSKHAPIGTGRSRSRILLTESEKTSACAADARRRIARNLLSDARIVRDAVDRYNVLSTIHGSSSKTLHSLNRGIHLMARISDKEWQGRLMQLCGFAGEGWQVPGVDAQCCAEARLECYLLQLGRGDLETWLGRVGIACGLEQGERGVWGEVYAAASGFLRRASAEMLGGLNMSSGSARGKLDVGQ